MHATRDKVLPVNRDAAEYYLRLTWGVGTELSKSLRAPVTTIPDYAEEKFKEYSDLIKTFGVIELANITRSGEARCTYSKLLSSSVLMSYAIYNSFPNY